MSVKSCSVMALIVGACVITASDAYAIREFKKPFEDRYVKHLDKDVQKTLRRANCTICHMRGAKKELNNAYGELLSQFIEGNADHRLKEARKAGNRKEELELLLKEFAFALEQVESLPSPDGETFGDRLKQGRLPIDLPPGASDDIENEDNIESEDDEADA